MRDKEVGICHAPHPNVNDKEKEAREPEKVLWTMMVMIRMVIAGTKTLGTRGPYSMHRPSRSQVGKGETSLADYSFSSPWEHIFAEGIILYKKTHIM